MIDLCVEAVTPERVPLPARRQPGDRDASQETTCPRNPSGHVFVENPRREWRREHCGQRL
ncbi:hypothetical protein LX15_002331 [Streptoalloteichus tenebrarius]|uniref:Transposase n=1 Tax=Streptoalloteichus tenebrarius (strain ATCC 17920 / DSM 40477 / JCM 4838 / CBS 697.72 / NBRC 16177 / NCIMB 11028 / NRRL B-12390 / A12253. 1 / ISP 5477) TaxID=1933 RepID=A0ABT1HSY0_STRSD|nr:hypothetical protein [Streptoalloteichus tenebrarius]BFF02777.1 hypothetical protein GCM10020241_44520 [Streptoalloteichus tenebrarius]